MNKPLSIAVDAARDFIANQPFQLAAALSYYTLLSIAPLLLVIIGTAGLLLGEAEVRNEIIEQARGLVGEDGARLLETATADVGTERENFFSVALGLLLTLVGASTVFAQLQVALNRVWQVEPMPTNALFGFLRSRLVSITVVFGLGFTLLVSLVLSAVLAGVSAYFEQLLPGSEIVWGAVNIAVSITLITLLLAMLFRFVPDAQVPWRDTLIGAFVTALLFTIGKYAIGIYLGRASVGSAYGAAGSAVVFMVWVYYASLILFFGATITKVVAAHRGAKLVPSAHARLMQV